MKDGADRGERVAKGGVSHVRLELDPADYRRLRIMAIESGVGPVKRFLERHVAELVRGGTKAA
jgi:hypothetical protein